MLKNSFCKNRHYIAFVGRTKSGHCKKCNRLWHKSYTDTHKNKRKEQTKKYRESHRKAINKRETEYQKQRRNTNINFKLSFRLRIRLNTALKNNYKSGSAVNDLGCSVEKFKQYLESKFKPGMSWDLYGFGDNKWVIDHIIPLASFYLCNKHDLLKAVHYRNLQPLWSKDNLKKSNKI